MVETKVIASDRVQDDNFGSAVAIDGDVMVVAAPGGADLDGVETSGAVYVFLRDPTDGEWLEHQHLLLAHGDFGAAFELSLAVQGDTIVVGAPHTTMQDYKEGAVYVFERDQGGPGLWGEVATLADVSVGSGGHFGSSVALEGDLLVVGAERAGNGWVRIFERNRGGADNWGQVITLFHTAVGDAEHPRSFGSAVAVEGDLLVVGASRTSVSWIGQSDGAAYLFRRDATDPDRWDHVARLIVPGADQCVGGLTVSQFVVQATVEGQAAAAACAEETDVGSSDFGRRLALDGDTIVVSAPWATGDDGTRYAGKAYVYRRDSSNDALWQYVASLSGSEDSSYDYFGSALALAGDTVLIGARGTTIEARPGQGAAYLFERTAGGPDAWGEVQKLVAYDGLSGDHFGSAVVLDGAAKVIGAPRPGALGATRSGTVYIQAPEEPPGPPFEATGTLTDGGIVASTEGAMLGAVAGALSAPVDVAVRPAGTLEEPLEGHLEPVGDYILIAAESYVSAPPDKPFLVGLPIPEGVDPDSLGAAMLVSGERILDGPRSELVWLPVPGNYDPDSDLFVVGVFSLDPEPLTFALVAGQGDAPPSSALEAAAPTTKDGRQFYVQCGEPGFTWEDYDLCQQIKPLVAAEFVKAYDEFRPRADPDSGDPGGDVTENFPLPALKKLAFGFIPVGGPEDSGPVANWGGTLGPIYMVWNTFRPCHSDDSSEEDEPGIYSPGQIIICVDPTSGSLDPAAPDPQVPQLIPEVVETIRHELFHAFQYAYPAMRGVWNDVADWTIDGTATAVQNPDAVLTRAQSWGLRRLDVPLLHRDKKVEYRAQDFWIYFGRTRGLKYHYLKDLFEQGGDPVGANRFFEGSHGTSLGLAYWDWVKNQAMEKSFDFDGQLLQPCHIEAQVIGDAKVLRYPNMEAVPEYEDTLDGLTSAVVAIEFQGETGPFTVEVAPADNLNYKIYLEGEASCVSALENAPRGFNEAPSKPVYVLLSNVLHHPPGPESLVRYKVCVGQGAGGGCS